MNFNKHYNLEGRHAFLSASKYYWVNYDEAKLLTAYKNNQAIQLGTDLHNFARDAIKFNIKLPKSKKTLNMYVNDAIGFKMTPEQPLYYSENCFGTADAISFRNDMLRIHDLKTGENNPGHIEQLMIYAALFCLEYDVDPFSIGIELRIYQFDEVRIENPDPQDIRIIMDKIIFFDDRISKMQEEGV